MLFIRRVHIGRRPWSGVGNSLWAEWRSLWVGLHTDRLSLSRWQLKPHVRMRWLRAQGWALKNASFIEKEGPTEKPGIKVEEKSKDCCVG